MILVPWTLFKLVLILIAFIGAGCWWPRVTLLRSPRLSPLLFAAVIGAGLLASLTAVAGFCHCLTVELILPVAAAAVASGVLCLYRTYRRGAHYQMMVMVSDARDLHTADARAKVHKQVLASAAPTDRLRPLHITLLAFTVLILCYMFTGVFAPDSQQDSQWYHLSVARAWIEHNSLDAWLEVYPSNYNLLDSALYAAVLLVTNDSVDCAGVQWLFGVCGILLCGAFAFEWYGRRAAAWAVFLTTTGLTSSAWFVPMHTGNDLIVMTFMAAGLLLTVDELFGRPTNDGIKPRPLVALIPKRWGSFDFHGMDRMAAIGLCLGFALATKISALGWAMPSWLILIVIATTRKTHRLPVHRAVWMLGWIGLPCIVWLIRNAFIGCGNPIYPIGRGALPLRPGWEYLATRFTYLSNVYPLTADGICELAAEFRKRFDAFFSNAGPLFIVHGLTALILLPKFFKLKIGGILGFIGFMQWAVLFWLRGSDELVRQFGQTQSVVFVGSALLLTKFEDAGILKQYRGALKSAALYAAVLLIACSVTFRQWRWSTMPSNNWKFRPILADADRLAYLRGCVYTRARIDLYRELNTVLPNDAKVLVSDSNFPFYLERPYFWCDDDINYPELLAAHGVTDADGVRRFLQEKGISYVVAKPGLLPPAWKANLTPMTALKHEDAWQVIDAEDSPTTYGLRER